MRTQRARSPIISLLLGLATAGGLDAREARGSAAADVPAPAPCKRESRASLRDARASGARGASSICSR